MPKNPATAFYKRPHHHPQPIPRGQPPRLHPAAAVDPPVAMPFAPPRPAPSKQAAPGLSMGPPSGIRREGSKNLSKLNLSNLTAADHKKVVENQDINKIFSEMINPLGEEAMMPPPLSAIITPKVSHHEGNNARLIPKYFPAVSPPPSPIKPLKDSPEVIIGILIFTLFHTGAKILNLSKNSHFENLPFNEIHNFKISFFFKKNSHFSISW